MAGVVIACPSCGTRNRVPSSAEGKPRCAQCKADLPWVVHADDETFADLAERATVPVLVDLWAPWCGPCRMVGPLLEKLAAERAGTLKVVKVNVDESPRTQAKFKAQSIPTLVLLNRGKTVSVKVGALPMPQLRSWLDGALR